MRGARSVAAVVLLAVAVVLGGPLLVGVRSAVAATPANVDTEAPPYADKVLVRSFRTVFGRGVEVTAREHWYWRIVEVPSAIWFAVVLMDSAEYRRTLGPLADAPYIDRLHRNALGRPATNDEVTLWRAAFRNGSQNRATIIAYLVEHGIAPAIQAPNRPVERCRLYPRRDLAPVCPAGSNGHQRDVAILQIPRTNLYVNKAWFGRTAGLVAAARLAGYDLQGERDPGVPAWMFAPGSWRSYDEQGWLYSHGYPANPPGTSMHEWGLAVDLLCNGRKITEVPACWDWVRANGPARDIFLFHTVRAITDSEAWHFSSNAR